MTVAQTQTVVQFDAALRALAARAATRYPGEQARLERGLVIALNGGVTLAANGQAFVQSSSDPEVRYVVMHTCDCPDAARAPEGRCKHKWAKALVWKALQPTHARIAYHATFGTWYGQAIRDEYGRVWFVAEDTDRLYELHNADMADLHLHGRVDVAADQRRRDLEAGTDLSRLDALTTEATILNA